LIAAHAVDQRSDCLRIARPSAQHLQLPGCLNDRRRFFNGKRHIPAPGQHHFLPGTLDIAIVVNNHLRRFDLLLLRRLVGQAAARLGDTHSTLLHQAANLRRFWRGHYPDSITRFVDAGFQQFDRLDDHHRLGCPPDEKIQRLRYQRVDEGLQACQRLRIGKNQPAQPGAVDLPVLCQDELAKLFHYQRVAGRALGNGAVRQRVSVNAVSAKVFKHAANNAFTAADVAGKPDDVFSRPLAQLRTSGTWIFQRWLLVLFILALPCKNVKGSDISVSRVRCQVYQILK